jgi:hypothetical protein
MYIENRENIVNLEKQNWSKRCKNLKKNMETLMFDLILFLFFSE